MKRFLSLLLLAITITLVACENDSTGSSKVILTSDAEMQISMYGARHTITYTTKGDVSPEDIEVTNTASWLRIVDTKSLGEIVFETETNETGGTRMAAVTITFAAQRTTVVINQSGSPDEPKLTLTSESSITIERAAQPVVITYELENKNPDDFTVAKIDADWIYRVDTATDGEVYLYVATNMTNESRATNVKICYGSASFDVELTQKGEGGVNLTNTVLSGEYLGDAYSPNVGNYWIILSDRGFNADGNSLPFGTYYRIDAYGPMYEGSETMVPIPEGEYEFDAGNTFAPFTFATENSGFFLNDKNGKHGDITPIESGKMVVKSGEITLNLTIDGIEHTVKYTGSLTLTDAQGEANILTTLEEDYTLDLSHHSMEYKCYGDYYDFGYFNWMFVITPDNGVGDCVQFDIITAFKDEESGFAGEYEASDYLAASSIIPGWLQSGVMECSWIFTVDQDVVARIRTGKLSVTENDNGTFTVSIDVYDDLRNRITGTWTGSGHASLK